MLTTGSFIARLTPPYDPQRPPRVAVFRALPGLGDFLCAVPALRALRHALPDAEVTLIGLPQTFELAARFVPYVDRCVPFPGWPGLPDRPVHVEDVPAFLSAMQRESFDLAVQMHGDGSVTNGIVALWGARAVAGFHLPGAYRPDAELFVPFMSGEPEVRRCLRLLAHLGVASQGERLEFPLAESDIAALEALPEWRALNGRDYVCVHVGARVPAKRWSTAQFATVADALRDRGLKVVLTGTAAEQGLTAEVMGLMRERPVNLAGRTGLEALAALVSRARLVVGNDTGVLHMADALNVPSVVLFTGADPDRWAPLDDTRHRVLHLCDGFRPHDPGRRLRCLPSIAPAAVLEEADRLLSGVTV